jgi:hypothetical protein
MVSDKDDSILRFPNEADIVYKHQTEKNALDFVLDSFLGYQLARYGLSARYIIISNDKGFDHMIKFWKSYGFNISRTNRDALTSHQVSLLNHTTMQSTDTDTNKSDSQASTQTQSSTQTPDDSDKHALVKDSADKQQKKAELKVIIYNAIQDSKIVLAKKKVHKIVEQVIVNKCDSKKDIETITKPIFKQYSLSNESKQRIVEILCSRLADLRKAY